MLRTNHV